MSITLTTVSNVVSGASVITFLGILVKLAMQWIRGRHTDRAENDLAAGSVAPTLAERNVSALDAQLVVLEKANAAERASYERRIKALESDVSRLTAERDTLLDSVNTLRLQMEEMQRRLTEMKRQIDSLPPLRSS